jgi:hypothetical protein
VAAVPIEPARVGVSGGGEHPEDEEKKARAHHPRSCTTASTMFLSLAV